MNMKVVAVRLPADDVIGPSLNIGDSVDVVGVFKKHNFKTNRTTISQTFLRGVRVYSIGNRTIKAGSSTSSIVGLLVTDKQAEALVFVQDNGSIKLTLRDDDAENDGSVGPLEEIRKKLIPAEDFNAHLEIKRLQTIVDTQRRTIEKLKNRLKEIEKD